MKPSSPLKALLFLSLLGSINACGEQALPLQSIYQSNDCAIAQKTLKQIDTPLEFSIFVDALPRQFTQQSAPMAEIDFKTQTLVLFALGQKPSHGYRIEQYENMALINDKKLYLPIRIHQPKKNSHQAQVITSPCQLFVIPRVAFSTLVLVEE